MAIILYAITKDNYFCKKETPDKKIDDLAWMRIPTDRRFFRELTTLHANQPILAGYKTAQVMPFLEGRKLVSISSRNEHGIRLDQALQRYPEGIIVGGASVLRSTMNFSHRNYINSIITVRLPLRVPLAEAEDYMKDPLLPFKDSGILKLSSQFFLYTDNFEQPTILVEIWRPTYND